MNKIYVAIAIAIALPSFVRAQTDTTVRWPITAGARVRVLSPALGATAEIGTALAVDADTLVFLRERAPEYDTLSTFAIKQLDVSTGRHTWKGKGALLGFAIGAIGGAVIGYEAYTKPTCTAGPGQFCVHIADFGRATSAAVLGSVVGLVGAVTGAIVGSAGSDTWTPVQIR